MASFSNIFVLFLPEILLSVSCCNVLYVSILLSRLLVRSKSVQKCSTAQSFTFPKFTSFKLGTLEARAEFLAKLSMVFGRFKDTKMSFRNKLTFRSSHQSLDYIYRVSHIEMSVFKWF